MEITVISAEGLKNTSSSLLFSHKLRPFITLTTVPPYSHANKGSHVHVYQTRVDHEGGVHPSWGDKFELPIDSNFLYQPSCSCIYLQLYTKRLMVGQALLGWCKIPAADVFPAGTVRRLSYRLRARDGSRGHGVVNVAVKLQGSITPPQRPLISNMLQLPSHTVMGIPVGMLPPVTDYSFVYRGQLGVNCKDNNWTSGPPK